MSYRFGDYFLNTDTRQLLRHGKDVHVSPKAFDLLTALVENRSRALSKTELQQHLWPSTFVEETNLAGLVAELRRALGDGHANPRFIRTIFRFGYRFVAEAVSDRAASAEPGRPRWWLRFSDREIPLAHGANTIGRSADAAIQIDSPSMSRRHARILVSAAGAMLEDLGSKNGTHLNGRRLDAPSQLSDGDEIRLGAVVATFRATAEASPTETVITEAGDV